MPIKSSSSTASISSISLRGSTPVVISISTSGDNTIIAVATGKKHRIVKLLLMAADTVSVILKTGSTALTGAIPLSAYVGFGFDGDFYPLDCATGEAFIINLSGAVGVYGWAQYVDE